MPSNPGPGVDTLGQAVIDPTENVKDLAAADRRRADDLRDDDRRYLFVELRHVEEKAQMRAEHAAELRIAESRRIDAIRAVDVGAATILANQVRDAAETLRLQVETARVAQAGERDAALQPVLARLAELERRQYEQAGAYSAGVEQKGSNQWLITTYVFGALTFISIGVAIIALLVHVKV